jgi:hypothetical protein
MLGGQGIGLPPPQGLWYPLPINQAYQPQGNPYEVPAGGALYMPAGWWEARTGRYTMVQWLDPVSNYWTPISTLGRSITQMQSDGSNFRIVNPTGCPVGALVTNVGSGYVQASTTAALSVGNSTWAPIVGGALTAIAVGNDSAGNAGGTNYSVPPIVDIPPPPSGGIQATATAAISGGAVSSVTLVNQGGGYTAGMALPVIRPNPFDPNIGSITVPALTPTVGGAGEVAALLCTDYGSVLTGTQMAAATLTISGAGASATATPIFCMTVTAVAMSASGGGGYAGAAVEIDTAIGAAVGTPGAIVNPNWSTLLLIPRKAIIGAPVSGGVIGTPVITDGGLFYVAPSPLVLAQQGAAAPTTLSAATLTMGSASDTVYLQAMGGTF